MTQTTITDMPEKYTDVLEALTMNNWYYVNDHTGRTAQLDAVALCKGYAVGLYPNVLCYSLNALYVDGGTVHLSQRSVAGTIETTGCPTVETQVKRYNDGVRSAIAYYSNGDTALDELEYDYNKIHSYTERSK